MKHLESALKKLSRCIGTQNGAALAQLKDIKKDVLKGIEEAGKDSEKRYSEAAVYLHSLGTDINSRADDHYRRAIQIAAGINKED